VIVEVTPAVDVDVELWRPRTETVRAGGAERRRNLVDWSYRPGARKETVSVTNSGRSGAYGYLDVFVPENGANDSYAVRVRTVRRQAG
jgi:hypothetical protein